MPKKPRSIWQEIYLRASSAVTVVSVLKDGQEQVGSSFHIGEGVFLTARHVVEGSQILEVASTKSIHLTNENKNQTFPPQRFNIIEGPYYGANDLDIALFRAELGDLPLPYISVSDHTDFSFNEEDFVLSDLLLVGYPPISNTIVPNQIAVKGHINAVVRLRHSPALHFIVSATARGGFSGGVALNESGVAVGVITESQVRGGAPTELGFMSVLSIEQAIDLAVEHFGYSIHGKVPGRYNDTLFGANFVKSTDRPLSSFIYDASVFVYDDFRDVFAEIKCNDSKILSEAEVAYNAIVKSNKHEFRTRETLYTPKGNPSPKRLLRAAEAVKRVFEMHGYRMLPPERSLWQIQSWKKVQESS